AVLQAVHAVDTQMQTETGYFVPAILLYRLYRKRLLSATLQVQPLENQFLQALALGFACELVERTRMAVADSAVYSFTNQAAQFLGRHREQFALGAHAIPDILESFM